MRSNVLQPNCEPTDKELKQLMKEVMVDVKSKAKAAKDKFDKNLVDAFKKLK